MKPSSSQFTNFASRISPLSPRAPMSGFAGVISSAGSSSNLGSEGAEDIEMIKALKSPLLIQTPLQVILETMYDKLRTQTEICAQLQERVRKLEKFNVDGNELTDRVRMLEAHVDKLNRTKMPDIDPVDVYKRLDELSESAQQMHETMTAYSLDQHQDVQPRLANIERRLEGTYNLAGHMIAVADMAGELGVPLPDLDATGSLTVGEAITEATGSASNHRYRPAGLAEPFSSFASASAHVGSTAAASGTAQAPPPSGSSTRIAHLEKKLADRQVEDDRLWTAVTDLKAELGGLDNALAEALHNSGSRFKHLEDRATGISERLTMEVANLHKAMQNHSDDMSFTEFVKLQRQVGSLQEQFNSSEKVVQQLREREIHRLREGLQELQRLLGQMAQVRDVDQVFSQKLESLKAELEIIKMGIDPRQKKGGMLPRIGSRPGSPGADHNPLADMMVYSKQAPAAVGPAPSSLPAFPPSLPRPTSPHYNDMLKPPTFVNH